jgi:hypothetical protein
MVGSLRTSLSELRALCERPAKTAKAPQSAKAKRAPKRLTC